MTDTYLTKQGDMVDAIAYAKYGYTAGATEAVLAANPGLADMGPLLPENVTINLPALAPASPATIPPWICGRDADRHRLDRRLGADQLRTARAVGLDHRA